MAWQAISTPPNLPPPPNESSPHKHQAGLDFGKINQRLPEDNLDVNYTNKPRSAAAHVGLSYDIKPIKAGPHPQPAAKLVLATQA